MASDPVLYRTVTLVYAGCVSGSRWSCPARTGLSHDVGGAGCGTERESVPARGLPDRDIECPARHGWPASRRRR
jgi:hypothetical protein